MFVLSEKYSLTSVKGVEFTKEKHVKTQKTQIVPVKKKSFIPAGKESSTGLDPTGRSPVPFATLP